MEEDIELRLSESSFVSISPINKSANVLRGILDECFDKKSGKTTQFHTISEEHIYAAKGLLTLGKYSETALDFLTAVLSFSLKDPKKEVANGATISWTEDEKKNFKPLRIIASDALSSSSYTLLSSGKFIQSASFFDGETLPNGCFKLDGVIYCPK